MRRVSLFTPSLALSLALAACGDLEDEPADDPVLVEDEAQALVGAQDLRALDPIPVDLAAHRGRITAPGEAPAFLPNQRFTRIELTGLDGALHVVVEGAERVRDHLFETLVISSTDGSRSFASFELYMRCGAFHIDQEIPFEGALPDALAVEWIDPDGRVSRRVAPVR